MEKGKTSNPEIYRIASRAKATLNVNTEICILKMKAFKAMTGAAQRGGTYNYFQDRVFVNKNELDLRTLPHVKWTILHEYGHAYFARIFARNGFFPMIVYAAHIQDAVIENGLRHMWNGLCDCYVNELIFRKMGVKKFDPTTEETIDQISQRLTAAMCFHLFDYWKHGHNEQIAQKAKEKLSLEIIDFLEGNLLLNSLDNPINQMLKALSNIASQLFPIKVKKMIMLKEEIEKNGKATLPEFWGKEDKKMEIFQIT